MSSSLMVIRDSLQRRFDLIIKLKNKGDLYLETCNYVDVIASDSRLTPILESILMDRDCLFKNHNEFAESMTTRIHVIAQNIRNSLPNPIDSKEITALFNNFDKFANGKLWSSTGPTWANLESTLRSICRTIQDSKTIKTDEIFVVRDNSVIRFSSEDEELFAKCHENWDAIQIAKQTSAWGAWERLIRIYSAVNGTRRECHNALNQNVFIGSVYVSDVNEMKKIIANSSALKRYSLTFPQWDKDDSFNPELALIDLERIHNVILDRLNRTGVGLALLTKYQHRCEWYAPKEITSLTADVDEAQIEDNEKELTRKLCLFLHDNNVTPMSEVILGKNIPDVLIQSKEELFPIEVKVIRRNEKVRVRKGFNQIVTYIRTISASEGFYVIFCKGDFTLQIPPTILTDSYRINIVTINLPETSPSKRQPEIWTMTENDLLSL